jgi:hypothetical protein
MPGFTRILCPISACDWHHDDPNPDPGLGMRQFVMPDAATLAECEGDYAAAVGSATRRRDIEQLDAIIRTHVETHSAEEWMREIKQLRGELTAAQSELAATEVDIQRGLSG